ncbi:MAG: PorP/SprF family type IX secretion system membrane protein [Bacteroidetes bacterium]|nr:PorP/SprF family type IX secretion system membrane protein [Bacteroidota bacterium]
MQKTVLNKILVLVITLIGCMATAHAQLLPFGNGYYKDRYLLNPAMCGTEHGLVLNAAYRKEQMSFSESPTGQYLTAAYGLSDKLGVGLKAEVNQSGPLTHLNVMGTYSYHLILTEKKKIYMGLSLGVTNNHLGISKTNGEADDPSLLSYNAKGTQVDADFGVAYTDGALLVQAAAPGLVSQFKKDYRDWVNKPLVFAAVSYKAKLSEEAEGIYAEPMVAFRAIKGFDNIIDGGANFTFLDDRLNIMAVYHSSKSISAGAGLQVFDKAVTISAIYHSTPSALKTFSSGGIEIAVSASLGNLFKK